MSIKSTADWEGLKQVARVARLTLDSLAKQVRPGVTTGELDATAVQLFAAHGARSAPALVYGFPGTVLISVMNDFVVDTDQAGARKPVNQRGRRPRAMS